MLQQPAGISRGGRKRMGRRSSDIIPTRGREEEGEREKVKEKRKKVGKRRGRRWEREEGEC